MKRAVGLLVWLRSFWGREGGIVIHLGGDALPFGSRLNGSRAVGVWATDEN